MSSAISFLRSLGLRIEFWLGYLCSCLGSRRRLVSPSESVAVGSWVNSERSLVNGEPQTLVVDRWTGVRHCSRPLLAHVWVEFGPMRLAIKVPVAMSAVVLVLSACGDGLELSQEETAEAILTAEEFPLEGYTRGEVDESLPEGDGQENGEDSLAALLEGQDVPQACREALEATDLNSGTITAQSKATFTRGDASAPLPTEVELMVATVDGDSPLEALAAVNDECEEISVEEDGLAMTMSFSELEDLEGTKVSVAVDELTIDMLMGGTSQDRMVVAAVATGIDEGELTEVVDAQVDKLPEVSG